jgi:ubiquinone/menaquinone biosynthesis C-methylase UbiE
VAIEKANYMLNLMPERDVPQILSEFKRVLRQMGRLVLMNMSKVDDRPIGLLKNGIPHLGDPIKGIVSRQPAWNNRDRIKNRFPQHASWGSAVARPAFVIAGRATNK